MIDATSLLNNLMLTLAADRPIFHSEADFQHAVAWALQTSMPRASIRIERPLRVPDKVLHLDLLVIDSDQTLAIELKYKTRKWVGEIRGERFELANHGAQDVGGYDYIKDVFRLEEICRNIDNCRGIAIMLSNDPAYWRPPTTSAYASFRLTEGRVLQGVIGWPAGTNPGTMRNRERPLSLEGNYQLSWHDFGSGDENLGFRYLALPIV